MIYSARMHEGRKALVTGSASGIGKSLVQHLVNNGARVVCCDINEPAGRAVVDELNASRGTGSASLPVAFFVKLDVTSWDETVAAFKKAEGYLQSKLDYVLANAGTVSPVPVFTGEEGKPSTRSLDVNIIGTMNTVQCAINHFRAHKGGGTIIVTASLSGLYSFRIDPVYAASKHAVIGLVRSAALGLNREGIYLNAVAPGATHSGLMTGEMYERMTRHGLTASKENIIQAFDMFLKPDCKLTGQVAIAMNGHTHVVAEPLPAVYLKPRRKSRL